MTIEKLFIISVLSVVLFFTQSCQPNTCANGVMDGTETGIDCGGTDCPACPCGGGGTFTTPLGGLKLKTQAQLDSFGVFNYEIILGDLFIGEPNTDITSVSSLCSLRNLDSSNLVITSPLVNLDGLNNLESVRSLYLETTNCTNFNELNNLSKVNGVFSIERNPLLDNLTVFSNLDISNLFYLSIEDNPNLISLNGLQNLKVNGGLFINRNNSIQNLNGLYSNIDSLIYLGVNDNIILGDYCALISNIYVDMEFNILNNAYNPTLQDLQNGDCTP